MAILCLRVLAGMWDRAHARAAARPSGRDFELGTSSLTLYMLTFTLHAARTDTALPIHFLLELFSLTERFFIKPMKRA